MTRWKLEPNTTLRLMHAHNQRSRWHEYVLDAAIELGLFVGYRESSNHYDGSTDREWYVMTSQLETVGGMTAVFERAHAEQQKEYEPANRADV